MRPRHRRGLSMGAVFAVLLAITGCESTALFGYEDIRDADDYIPEATRTAIVVQGMNRDQVIQQLGQPEGTQQDVQSISYSRCVKSTGWGAFGPLDGPLDVESCQWVVFWFDDAGRAYRQTSSIAKCTRGKCEWSTRD